MIGWVCSYRKIWEDKFFKGNGMRVAIWHWLLHHAAWEDTSHTISGVRVPIKRGEVCFSQQQICDDTGATRKQVRDVLDYVIGLKKCSKIGANERANVRANAKTILVIEKYDEYQAPKKERANEGATEGPTKVTSKQLPLTGTEESVDLASQIFTTGLRLLTNSGVAEKQARSLLGKWRGKHGDAELVAAIGNCQRAGAINPVEYIPGCFRSKRERGIELPSGYTNAGPFGLLKELN